MMYYKILFVIFDMKIACYFVHVYNSYYAVPVSLNKSECNVK